MFKKKKKFFGLAFKIEGTFSTSDGERWEILGDRVD